MVATLAPALCCTDDLKYMNGIERSIYLDNYHDWLRRQRVQDRFEFDKRRIKVRSYLYRSRILLKRIIQIDN